jgi:hypothetical protein
MAKPAKAFIVGYRFSFIVDVKRKVVLGLYFLIIIIDLMIDELRKILQLLLRVQALIITVLRV